jgi:hypothetical protein
MEASVQVVPPAGLQVGAEVVLLVLELELLDEEVVPPPPVPPLPVTPPVPPVPPVEVVTVVEPPVLLPPPPAPGILLRSTEAISSQPVALTVSAPAASTSAVKKLSFWFIPLSPFWKASALSRLPGRDDVSTVVLRARG